uniref:Putative kunitz-like protease inhibitor n=2 Tax=Ixodes ricinus TaxID=34613 RepID=V5HA84_IXORI
MKLLLLFLGLAKAYPNICEAPYDEGRCRAAFPRFYFNSTVQECLNFTYGGCGGNENNFHTKKDCRDKCFKKICPKNEVYHECIPKGCEEDTCTNKNPYPRCYKMCSTGCFCRQGFYRHYNGTCVKFKECPHGPICRQSLDLGNGNRWLRRYYYNSKRDKCLQFWYSGEGGNLNNFGTRIGCNEFCQGPPRSICDLPLDNGNGKYLLRRYYYDQKKKKCLQFWYRGIGGNQNNFGTRIDCDKVCKVTVPHKDC